MEPASQAVSYRRSHEQRKGQQMTSARTANPEAQNAETNQKQKKKNKQAMRLKVLQHHRC